MADTPLATQVRAALVAALQGANGLGAYHYDLSASVYVGEYALDTPPRNAPPCLALVTAGSVEEWGAVQLTGRRADYTYSVLGWAPRFESLENSLASLEKLDADVRNALAAGFNNASSILYQSYARRVEVQTLDGAKQLAPLGRMALAITLSYALDGADRD